MSNQNLSTIAGSKRFLPTHLLSYHNVFCLYLLIFPLLPTHVGLTVAASLPVIKPQRVLTAIILMKILFDGRFTLFNFSFYKNSPYVKWLFLFFFSACLSGLFSSGRLIGTAFYLASQYFENVFFAVMVFNFITAKKDVERIFQLLSWTALSISLIAIGEHFSGVNLYSTLPGFSDSMKYATTVLEREGSVRVRASFDHPISLGCYLALSMPAVLYYTKNRRIKGSLFIITISTAIMYTHSRSAIICLVAILIYFGWKSLFGKRETVLLLLGLTTMGILVVLLNHANLSRMEDMANRYMNPFSSNSEEMMRSTTTRMRQIMYVKSYMNEHFMFGNGFESEVRKFDGLRLVSVDNYYLSIFLFFGMSGLTIFLLFQVMLIRQLALFKFREMRETKEYIFVATTAFYLIIATVSLMTFHFVFWVYLGVISACSRRIVVAQPDNANRFA